MTLLLSFLAAVAAATIVGTFVQTAAAYSSLPARVPLGLNWDGTLRSMAPRPMICLLPAIQVFCAGIFCFSGWAIATEQPGTHGTILQLTVDAVAINAVMWRTQSLLIFAARSGQQRVPTGGFWPFLIIAIGAILIVSFALH